MSRDASLVNVQIQSGTSLSLFFLRLSEVSAEAVMFTGIDVMWLFDRSTADNVADQAGVSGRQVTLLCDRFSILRLGSWSRLAGIHTS